jgi:hypothetical protein
VDNRRDDGRWSKESRVLLRSSEKNFIDSKNDQIPLQMATDYGERKAITPQGEPKSKRIKRG